MLRACVTADPAGRRILSSDESAEIMQYTGKLCSRRNKKKMEKRNERRNNGNTHGYTK